MQAELHDRAGPVSEEEKLFIKYFWAILLDFCEEIYLEFPFKSVFVLKLRNKYMRIKSINVER